MKPLEIPPGVQTAPTKASYSSRWRETQLIRWVGTRMTIVGGWEKYDYPPFASLCRAVYKWTDNASNRYTAYLCEAHLYVDIGGELFDISPTPALIPPFGDVALGGYGDFTYSYDTYGTPRPEKDLTKAVAPCYSLGNWGEQLLAMTSSDGRLLYWDPATPATPAQVVPDAPINNRLFVVTPERHVVLFGKGGDKRKLGWCDTEDYSNWNIADVASTAGEYDVEPAAPLLSAVSTADGVLVFSSIKAYMLRYVGLPYIYSLEEKGDGSTPISTASLVNTAGGPIWPSESNFWTYDGSSIVPLPCPVWDWIENSVKYTRFEAAGINVAPLSEYWWFFPAEGSRYNDRYIIYNYAAGWWATGFLSRSCGASSAYDTYPAMADQYSAYKHESGMVHGGAPFLPYAETFNLNVNSGDNIMMFDQMMPDIEGDVNAVQFRLKYRDNRSRQAEIVGSPKTITPNGYVNFRTSGRDFLLRAESIIDNVQWTIGQNLVELIKRGNR